MMTKKTEGAVGLLTLALAVISLLPMAMVQALREPMIGEWGYDPSDYWTLWIYMHTAGPACTPKVLVQAIGPFGHEESEFFSGNDSYVTPSLAKKDFPAGQQYQIGIGAPNLCLPEYTPFAKVNATATGGDQYFAYYYKSGNTTVLPASSPPVRLPYVLPLNNTVDR